MSPCEGKPAEVVIKGILLTRSRVSVINTLSKNEGQGRGCHQPAPSSDAGSVNRAP